MMNKKRTLIMITIILAIISMTATIAYAAPNTIPIPNIDISIGKTNSPQDYVDNIKLLIVLTLLTLLPSFLVMMTSFTRIIVTFGFVRNALGTQQTPPNQVLIGLSIFLTIFIMTPTFNKINNEAVQPFLENKINQEQALEKASSPMREFMLKETRNKDLQLFLDISKVDKTKINKDNVPLYIVIPAFIISELKTAFTIGFLIYIPFLIIDIVVASVLMAMGMFMLPPVMISLPFKLLLFVMVDGWYLLVGSLVKGFM